MCIQMLAMFLNGLSRSNNRLIQNGVPCPPTPASQAQSHAAFTYSFLGLLLGGTCLLCLLDDSIEGKAEPSHTGKITDANIKIQALPPHRFWTDVHFRAWHCLAQHLIAVKETCLHHQLGDREIREHHESTDLFAADMMRRGMGHSPEQNCPTPVSFPTHWCIKFLNLPLCSTSVRAWLSFYFMWACKICLITAKCLGNPLVWEWWEWFSESWISTALLSVDFPAPPHGCQAISPQGSSSVCYSEAFAGECF